MFLRRRNIAFSRVIDTTFRLPSILLHQHDRHHPSRHGRVGRVWRMELHGAIIVCNLPQHDIMAVNDLAEIMLLVRMCVTNAT